MFDPWADGGAAFPVRRPIALWVEHCVLGLPVEQIAKSRSLDPIEAGEEVIHGMNEAARYPTMTRCSTFRTWLELAKSSDELKKEAAKVYARCLFTSYDQKVLFDYLHQEHHFSMHDLLEMFRADD